MNFENRPQTFLVSKISVVLKTDNTNQTTTHDSLSSGGAKSKQLPLDSTTHKHPLIYLIMTNNRRNSGIPQNKTLTGQKKINKKSQPPPPSSPLLNVDVDEPRYEKCPCARSDTSSWLMKCTKCTQNWHSNCCNLRGIKEDFVTQLEDWQCPLCFTAPGLANVQNKRTEQLLLSMAALQGKNNDLEKAVRHLEDKLSALISDTDQLRTSTNNVAEKLIRLSDIELHIQHRTIQEGQFDDRIKTMSSQLTNLQTSFTELKETTESSALSFRNSPAPPPKGKIPNSIEAFVEPQMESLVSKVEVHAETIENFLDDDTCKAITEFLDCEPFTEENGHSVLLFGHPYSYTGSKALSDSPEIPPVFKPLFDKLNKLQAKAFNERYPEIKSKGPPPVLNSCLVNKFVGPDSFLSEHSDDETTIHPESSVFTISLGAPCKVTFADKIIKGDEQAVTWKHGSVYWMTRKSQEFFTHRIDKGAIEQGTRLHKGVDRRRRSFAPPRQGWNQPPPNAASSSLPDGCQNFEGFNSQDTISPDKLTFFQV
ncbi:hypothetical protein ACHWQZ_G010982 [Mnemiopsis leidyi]